MSNSWTHSLGVDTTLWRNKFTLQLSPQSQHGVAAGVVVLLAPSIQVTLDLFDDDPRWKEDIHRTINSRHLSIDLIMNKHNAELQRTDPGTKVTGEFSTRGHIFSPNV